jgi:hypothetical protein
VLSGAGPSGAGRLELPGELDWSLHRGQTEPIMGWYSPGLGRRIPACTLIGQGRSAPRTPLRTRLTFDDKDQAPASAGTGSAVRAGPPPSGYP